MAPNEPAGTAARRVRSTILSALVVVSTTASAPSTALGETATAWLSKHGATYQLCRIYRNEPWHSELRPDAIDDGCPSMYADPRHDPRMHQ